MNLKPLNTFYKNKNVWISNHLNQFLLVKMTLIQQKLHLCDWQLTNHSPDKLNLGSKIFSFFFFLNLILFTLFIYFGCVGSSFRARAFSSCSKRGPLFIAVRGPLLLRSTGSRRAGSVIVAHGPSCSAACGIFSDQGSNPCSLHWQAGSQPLRHQGSPRSFLKHCI